jgi:predicted GTPase
MTHGGLATGAGTVAAKQQRVGVQIDPRPLAIGSIAETFENYPHIGAVLPAMGYSDRQLRELEQTINAAQCDAVIAGTPVDLARVIRSRHPVRQVTYELRELGEPTLEDVLAPIIARVRGDSG